MQCTHTIAHTDPPSVTTPYSIITLGCLNWAIMAASCRNLTLSSFWDLVGSRTLIATSYSPFGDFHFPLWTPPNCPCPNADFVLKECHMNGMHISYDVGSNTDNGVNISKYCLPFHHLYICFLALK